MSTHLKQLCHTHLPGNKEDSPAEHFAKMAKWCEENKVNHDVYGEEKRFTRSSKRLPICWVTRRAFLLSLGR